MTKTTTKGGKKASGSGKSAKRSTTTGKFVLAELNAIHPFREGNGRT